MRLLVHQPNTQRTATHHHGRTPNSAYTKTTCIFTIRQNSGAANIQTNWSGAQSKMCSMHEDSQQSVPPTFHIHIYMRMRQSGRGSLTHIQPNTNIYGIYCSRWKYEKTEKKKRKALEGRGSSSSSNSGGIGRADETNVRRPDVRLARTTERNPRCRIHSIISVWIVHVHTLARCVPCHTADVSPPSPMSAIVHVCDRKAANGGSSECMHSAQNGIIQAQPECDRPRLHT